MTDLDTYLDTKWYINFSGCKALKLTVRIGKKFPKYRKSFRKESDQLNEDKMNPFPATEIKREYLITSSVYCTRSRIENITRMILVKSKFDSGIVFATSAKRRTFADTHDFRLTYTHVIIITIVHVQVINVVSVYVCVCVCVCPCGPRCKDDVWSVVLRSSDRVATVVIVRLHRQR